MKGAIYGIALYPCKWEFSYTLLVVEPATMVNAAPFGVSASILTHKACMVTCDMKDRKLNLLKTFD